MTEKKVVIALDQGTTSSRAIAFNKEGKILGVEQKEFKQIYPQQGWVEHDPMEILETQIHVFQNLMKSLSIQFSEVAAIGITNQRETTVVWNKVTGLPVYNAIVWQDRRTASICEKMKADGWEGKIKQKTGLVVDAYFSGTKIKWILDHVEGARKMAESGELIFGTIDTWLIWNLTNGKIHATDYSNASRTLIFNIDTLQWDKEICDYLGIPSSMLPEVKDSSSDFGYCEIDDMDIPITGVAGDQQSALFGQCCFNPGDAKNTYGTGCFMLMNTGNKRIESHSGLITTIAWGIDGKVEYALEGSVFIGGAAVQWLRDELKLIESAGETESLAKEAKDVSGVYVVPAFAGLGAPYWDMYARGGIFGLSRDIGKAELVKATLESMAYQSRDLLSAMEKDSGEELNALRVDGGACANNYLMQFQSDILGSKVLRPEVTETTAMGAAFLAGLYSGFWVKNELSSINGIERAFSPVMEESVKEKKYRGWQKAVDRCKNWVEDDE